MMRLVLVVVITLFASCGDKKEPSVGRNNQNDPDVGEDMGSVSIFPDVRISDPDIGPVDLGRDAASDAGNDAANPPDLGQDVGVDMQPMNCPRSNVPAGSPCACNQECTTGVCADASLTVDGFCTTACANRSDCPAGQACATDRFGESVCRDDDTGATCTDTGQAAPEVCSTGHCLQAGSNFALDFFCSVPCSDSMDCKMGHACTPVRCQFNPAEGYRCLPSVVAQRASNTPQVLLAYPESTKLCMKVGDPNPCGAQTMASDEQACPGSMCDSTPTGRCTAGCLTTADCPAGGCVDYDLSDSSLPVRVCDL